MIAFLKNIPTPASQATVVFDVYGGFTFLERQGVGNVVYSEFLTDVIASGVCITVCFLLNTYGALHFIK